MKKFFKKLLIKSTAILCSAMLLFMSPYAGYLDASSIQTVYASDWAIVGGGVAADAILKFLIGLLGSVAAKETYEEYEEEINQSFYDYFSAPGRWADLISESAKDTCVKIYDKASNTIHEVSWEDVWEGLHEFHDDTVDGLTGIYVKYCPQLLDICYDFVGDVIDGDIYVPGISSTITEYENITEEDIKKQRNGELYTASFVTHRSYIHTNPYYHYSESRVYHRWFDVELSSPIAAVYNTSVSADGLVDHNLVFYKYDSRYIYLSYRPTSYISTWIDGVQTRDHAIADTQLSWGLADFPTYSHNQFACFGNIPIFSTREAMETYFRTGEGYENALNYGISVYDDIESTATLPPFHKEWIQELLNKINNRPGGIGIGSYGQGISAENWIDHIPWLSLDSLREYYRSLDGIYRQMIDDIINGNYDYAKGIPGTYSEAWEQTISEAWDNVEQADTVPGESEKDKPTDEDEDEKDDPEGGGGSGDSNNDQEEPPEGGRFTEEEIQEIIKEMKGDGFKNNPIRQAYEEEVRALKGLGEALLASGKSLEEVARTLWQARRDLGIQYKEMTPELLREYIYEINLIRYGDKLGPSFEYFTDKLGKSFEEIIDSSSRPNIDIDKLLEGFEEWLRRQ